MTSFIVKEGFGTPWPNHRSQVYNQLCKVIILVFVTHMVAFQILPRIYFS